MTLVFLLLGPAILAFGAILGRVARHSGLRILVVLAWCVSVATALRLLDAVVSGLPDDAVAGLLDRFVGMWVCVCAAIAAGIAALLRGEQPLGAGFLAAVAHAVVWPGLALYLGQGAAMGLLLLPIGVGAQAIALHIATVLVAASVVVTFRRQRALALSCLLLIAGQGWALGDLIQLGTWAVPDDVAQLFWVTYFVATALALGFAIHSAAPRASAFGNRVWFVGLRLSAPLAPITIIWPQIPPAV